MKKNAFVFDCDEVLLNHLSGLRDFIITHYDIVPKTDLPLEYNLTSWLGVTDTEVQEIIKHFNERSFEFGLLNPVSDETVFCLSELKNKFSDHKFIVLTKSGTLGHGEVLRKVNLINTFGNDMFDEIIIIEMYESKKGALNKLKSKYNVKFLVDDYIKNIETAMDLEIPAIMMRSSHNNYYSENNNGFIYVNNWHELKSTIEYIVQGE